MSIDPPRLLEDASTSVALRSDLAHAASATLEGLDLSVGAAQLRSCIAAADAASGSAATSTGLTKVVVGALLVGGLGAWVAYRRPLGWPAASSESHAVVQSGIAGPAIATPPRATHDVIRAEVKPLAWAIQIPPTLPAPRVVPPPSKARPHGARGVPATPPPAHEPDNAAHAPTPADADEALGVEPVETSATAESGSANLDAFVREARLVAQARRILESDPSTTLTITDRMAFTFPHGQLGEEREALAIRALARLGRAEEARTRATSFLARYGLGPHANAVRRVTSMPPPTPGDPQNSPR